MNEVTNFSFTNVEVRTIYEDDVIWFALVDVCKILELSNSRKVANTLDDDERRKYWLRRQGNTWFVNEPGLYHVILTSRSEKAKLFRRWVTHEVLPSIRKQGFYSTLTDDKLIELLQERKKNNPNYVKELMQKEKTVTKELKDQTREKRLEETVEIWRRYFDKHEEIDVPKELKRIWRGDMPMFHKYLDKFHVDERKQAKGKIIII